MKIFAKSIVSFYNILMFYLDTITIYCVFCVLVNFAK